MNAKFNVLIDKNKFSEAELFVDSVYQSNPDRFDRGQKKREIFSKKIDFYWTENQLDNILLAFKNYRFITVFPDEGKSSDDNFAYNNETIWMNDEIEKMIFRLCKVNKGKTYELIETYFRPKGVSYKWDHEMSNGTKLNCKFYKDYSRKGILAEIVNNCH